LSTPLSTGRCIEKIKSTGATYMAASGLTANTCDRVNFSHVTAMADYALQLFDKIEEVNMHSFNNFRMRIGENIELEKVFKLQIKDITILIY